MRNIENWITYLRFTYPTGTRIKLIQMLEDPNPVEPGTLGTVDFVDDAGHIHITWDNGRSLALIPNIDEFQVVKED